MSPSRDLPDSFDEIVYICLIFSANIFLHISHETNEMCLGNIYQKKDVELTWDPRGAFSVSP